MKLKNNVLSLLLILGVVVNNVKGCKIIDPTYDFAFKALFGSSGTKLQTNQPKGRLQSLLNSILNPLMQITVKDLSYKDTESTTDSRKDLQYDIVVECTCERVSTGSSFIIDIEMQRAKTVDYVSRMNVYGNRLADIYTQCSNYEKQPRTIVISIIDNELDGYKNEGIFFIRPYFQRVYSFGETEHEAVEVFTDFSVLQIYIQLPVLCGAIIEGQDHALLKNEWIKLLGSRRLNYNLKSLYTEDGSYNIKEGEFSDADVKSAIYLLKQMNENKTQETSVVILQHNMALKGNEAQKQKMEELEKEKYALEQKNLKNILSKDIQKYKGRKSKASQKYKFAKRLKGLTKEQLLQLIPDNQRQKFSETDYAKNFPYSQQGDAFEDKSMSEDWDFD